MLEQFIGKITSFNDFYSITQKLTNKQIGDLFEEFTKYLFIYHPNYANITQKIWLYNEIPNTIKTKLNIPNKDEGIDLVMLSQSNKYYAIQCKFRTNKDTKIKWEELGTFVGMTFGIANGFENGFFVTNTTSITKNIMNSNKVIPLYGEFFDNIPSDVFKIIKSHLTNKSINHLQLNPCKPRDYQIKIIVETYLHFENNDRGYLEMACGSGKSLTAYWINSCMSNKLCIVAVPSLYLLSQFYNEFSTQTFLEKSYHQFILVGSDADVDNDKFYNNGLLITTDVTNIKVEITNIINKSKLDDMELQNIVILTTYQSSDKLITALNQLKLTPDLLIADEAHKTVGASNKQFNLLLDDKNLKIKKRLFMTATPKVYSGDGDNEKIISMDDEKWYGKQIYMYNTYNAITDKHLSDYQIVTMYTNNEYINGIIQKNKYINTETMENEESHYVACAILLLNAMKNNECHHLVTYHNSINKSKKFRNIMDSLKKYYDDDISVYHLDGTMSMNKRNNIVKSFKEANKVILTSARVLNEGINIPEIDSECFIDPRTSMIDTVQCIGRSLRLHKNKTIAKIFVPTLVDDINTIDENKAFGNIIRIIKSMSNTDTGITEYFVAKKNGKEHNRTLIKHVNLMNTEKIGEDINIDEWINEIEMRIWKKSDGREYMYQKVKEWIEKNNKVPSKHSRNSEEKQLGIWCSDRRYAKSIGTLDKEMINNLESLKIWFWDINEKNKSKYEQLLKWVCDNNKIPSQTAVDPIEHTLGRMCSTIRKSYYNNSLSMQRIKKFESIPNWFWTKSDPFDGHYNELIEFFTKHKKMPASRAKDIKEKKLGRWCSQMKSMKNMGKLEKSKVDKLNKLSFWKWYNKSNIVKKSFDEAYKNVHGWVIQYDKLPTLSTKNNNEHILGSWCAIQRRLYKTNALSDARIKKLELIKGWYWIQENFSDELIIKIQTFIETYNKMPSQTSKNITECKLGQVCQQLRTKKKNNKLSESEIKRLETILLWFWIDETNVTTIKTFDENYNDVKTWISVNNKMPSAKSADILERKYGEWCQRQRNRNRIGKLEVIKINKLNQITKWYW